MNTEVKVEKNNYPVIRSSNFPCQGRGEQTKIRPKLEGETVNLDGVCFDCYNGNHANSYSQGMRKVSEYFGCTARYGTEIQSTIMKESLKIIMKPVEVNTGNTEIEKMLLGKELLEWVLCTSKLSANMGKAYNVILR